MAGKVPQKPSEDPKDVVVYDYSATQGMGYDGQGAADELTQPIKLLQPGSPEVLNETVVGAKAGDFLDPATGTLYKSFLFAPVVRDHVYTEWLPRDAGGGGGQGWVAEYEVDDPIVIRAIANNGGKRFGKLKHPTSGNVLEETFRLHIVLAEDVKNMRPTAVIFTSTQIKPYKEGSQRRKAVLVGAPGNQQAPAFWAHLSRMTVTKTSNAKGTWFKYQWEPAGEDLRSSLLAPDSAIFMAGHELYKRWLEKQVRVDMRGVAPSEEHTDEADADLPF